MQNILVTGGAGFVGSNLTLTLQQKFPAARITVVDDFRSGSFKNLEGFKGDVIAADLTDLNPKFYFKGTKFDALFHLASITDTTEHDQLKQVRDNVESWRTLLDYFAGKKTALVYASSAATYGIGGGINKADAPLKPANVYAFSKVQLENLAARYGEENPTQRLVGLRYFNVYGPKEIHKGAAASMILQLARQIEAGKTPRLFKYGEQKRDFVYVADVVAGTIAAATAPKAAGVYNLGSGKARSFNDILTGLNAVLGTKVEAEYFDCPFSFYQPHTEADLAATTAALRYVPKFTLEAGIKDYFKSGWLVEKKAEPKAEAEVKPPGQITDASTGAHDGMKKDKFFVTLTLIGPDRKGVVARFTQLLFRLGANIERLEEQVARSQFSMILLASWEPRTRGLDPKTVKGIGEALRAEAKNFGLECAIRFSRPGPQRMGLLVTKEPHVLQTFLAAVKRGTLSSKIAVVISNRPDLGPLAKKAGLPFHVVDWKDRAKAEAEVLALLDWREAEYIVLGRFMKILSPNFVWRWKNKIINIHPSLLPAFPGANAYRQAFEKGVKAFGVTAHFVTPQLDEGPIIAQEAAAVRPGESLASMVRRGQAMESKCLLRAVKLYLSKKLDVHWNRVHDLT